MNKKLLLISGLAIIVVLLLIMAIRNEPLPVLITAEDEMPDFQFQLITGGFIQASDMDDEKFTLLWFFNTECDICIDEARLLTDSISLLNNCQIVMVSYEDSIKVVEFNERFLLSDLPHVYVACVPEEYVSNVFKVYVNPTLYVYHPDKRMIKYKPGSVTVHEIVEYLNN